MWRSKPITTAIAAAAGAAMLVVTAGVGSGSAASSPGPNGASHGAAVRTGAMRTIPPSGSGAVRFIGTADLSAQPDAKPQTGSVSRVGALRVPGWFHGPAVGGTSKAGTSAPAPLVTTPTVVRLNKAGTLGSQSSCGCQPPDTNGSINSTYIVEAVNLSLTVYKRAGGALLSRKSLASFFPTSRGISDPRIQYDNVANRWVLTFIPIPETTSTTPQLYIAASATANPLGSWFRYTVSFSGGLYPPGTLLDYPMLGQDQNAALLGTNNFRLDSSGSFNYINSAVFAIPKNPLYHGGSFSFPAFATEFSTHPSIPRGSQFYTKSYFLASNGSGGYTLYYMTNTAGTPTLTLQGTSANGLWSPPPGATQPAPNGSVVLDTLDGRLQAHPTQTDLFLWFTHAVNIGGFAGVRYGAIDLSSSGIGGVGLTTNNAYASATSNDWNPSIAVSEPSSNANYVFLNWATDDPFAGINVGIRVSGVGPGEGVPFLGGIGNTLFTGGGSAFQTRFGDFSSATMETKNISSSCKFNTQALVVNQVFKNNDWQVRLARIGFC